MKYIKKIFLAFLITVIIIQQIYIFNISYALDKKENKKNESEILKIENTINSISNTNNRNTNITNNVIEKETNDNKLINHENEEKNGNNENKENKNLDVDLNINSNISEFKIFNTNSGNLYLSGRLNAEFEQNIEKYKVSRLEGYLVEVDKNNDINTNNWNLMYISKDKKNSYYFDKNITELDKTKKYTIIFKYTNIDDNKKNYYIYTLAKGINNESREYHLVLNNKNEIKNDISKNDVKYTKVGFEKKSVDIKADISELKLLDLKEKSYISGYVKMNTDVNFKDLDILLSKIDRKTGNIVNTEKVYYSKEKNNSYYFDKNITGIDINYDYTISVLYKEKNVELNYLEKVKYNGLKKNLFNELEIKDVFINDNYEEYKLHTNRVISFKEVERWLNHQLLDLSYTKIRNESNYIIGNIVFVKWIDGKPNSVEKNPKIYIKNKSGFSKEMYVARKNGYEFYFDANITGEEKIGNDYYFQIEDQDYTTRENLTSKVRGIDFKGNYSIDNKFINVKGSDNEEFTFTIVGENESIFKLNKLRLLPIDYAPYLSGEIKIVKYINGKKHIFSNEEIQNGKIKIYLKEVNSTNNRKRMYFNKLDKNTDNTNLYYFDINLTDLDTTKEYKLEIELENGINIEKQEINILDKYENESSLGEGYSITGKIKNSNILFENITEAKLKGELIELSMIKETNSSYIKGLVEVSKYYGTKKISISEKEFNESKPKVQINSANSEYIKDMYVGRMGKYYYFDANIQGIDKNKDYKIYIGDKLILDNKYEEEKNNINNMSEVNVQNYRFKNLGISNRILGKINNDKINFKYVEYEEGNYGTSHRGRPLRYVKIGNGENVFFGTFAVHGWEDNFPYDGKELTYIGEKFRDYLLENYDENLLNRWTIYLCLQVNPDGANEGWTHNGPGRTTLSSYIHGRGIDINRSFEIPGIRYARYTSDRNFNGDRGYQSLEVEKLKDFLISKKSQTGQTVLVDLHGWLEETIGDEYLGEIYRKYYGMSKHIYSYGTNYLINFARSQLGNSNYSARSTLVELPSYIYSHMDVLNNNLANKYIYSTLEVLNNV